MTPLAFTKEALRLLAATIDTAALGSTISIRLFTNDVNPDGDTVVGDLTIADYTGYVSQDATVFGTGYDDANGNALMAYPSLIFQPTGVLVGNTVYGWFAVGVTGSDWATKLIAAQRFDAPMPMNGPADAVIVQPMLGFNQPIDLRSP